jgi:signal transduction histidine kinase
MTPWRGIVGDRPIVTRLVLAVATAMSVVLLLAGAFVFWRVQYALDRQLDQDLAAYTQVIDRAVSSGTRPATQTPGQTYQVYDATGAVVGGNATRRLLEPGEAAAVTPGTVIRGDVGRLLPPADDPYRFVATRVSSPAGPLVVATAISRHHHDEALRELLLQLGIADLVTLVAASLVGYLVARAALKPVERYRRAAESSDGDRPLPVASRDDEISRLGHTFNSLLERIRDTSRRERQFLADASHELRSPLAVMRTELEMARRAHRSPAETQVALRSLSSQVERLIDLANALLELEELKAGGRLHRDPVDPASLIRGVADRYAAEAAAQHRVITTDIDPALEMTGNRHWLDLALGNLVANALRYGTGTVAITATNGDHGATLVVEDEGPGPPPEFAARAFDRFTRADDSRSTAGTGLGLALVRAVAEAHGGSARMDGASVRISWPSQG